MWSQNDDFEVEVLLHNVYPLLFWTLESFEDGMSGWTEMTVLDKYELDIEMNQEVMLSWGQKSTAVFSLFFMFGISLYLFFYFTGTFAGSFRLILALST